MKTWTWIIIIFAVAMVGWAVWLKQSPACGCGG